MTNFINFHPSASSGYMLPLSVDLRPTLRVFAGALGVSERLAPFGVREFALYRRTAREHQSHHQGHCREPSGAPGRHEAREQTARMVPLGRREGGT
jgi:hypothetical protein